MFTFNGNRLSACDASDGGDAADRLGAPDAGDADRDPYRDALPALRARLALLLRRQRGWIEALRAVEDLRAARLARIAAGHAAIAGVVAVGLEGLLGPTGALTVTLLAADVLVLATWGATRLALASIGAARVAARFRLTGDVQRDLARVEDRAGGRELLERARGLEAQSVALPLIAMALLMPLTIQLLVSRIWEHGPLAAQLENFDKWIIMSAIIVGHAHVVLALLAIRFARRLARGELVSENVGWHALGWTVLASAIPGVLLVGIPPALTFGTGLLFVPTMFARMRGRIAAEREVIDHMSRGAP